MNTFESRVSKRLLAGTAVAAIGVVGLAGCTSGNTKAAVAPSSTTQPAVPTTEAAPTTPVVTEALIKSKTHFEDTARATASDILADIADPRSLSQPYSANIASGKVFAVGNKAGLQKAGKSSALKPEMYVQYYSGERTLGINSIRIENPAAPLGQMIFDRINIVLGTGNDPNNLDAKIASDHSLSIGDMQQFMATHPTEVEKVTIQHDQPAAVTELARIPDGGYSETFTQGQHGGGMAEIDDVNRNKYDQVAQDLLVTEGGLHAHL